MSLPSFSVKNPVFVNMMMVVTIFAGAAFAMTLVREMFPESRPNRIAITAFYPATQPSELERAVTIKIEEAVRDVEGVEKVDSSVTEGLTRTVLTLYNSVKNVDVVLQLVKNEVDALQDLPDDLEKITVTKIEPTLPVIMVSVFGDGDERALKQAARDIKDDLLDLPGVSDVTISGIRDDEISVEINPERLLEYNLTFDEIAAVIRQTNLDVSAGNLRGDRSQVSVRTLGERQTGRELERLEVRALPDGQVIRLADVAEIRDGFVETDVESYWAGKRSATLTIQKTPSQDAIQISSLVKCYVAGKQGAPFPLGPREGAPQGLAAWLPDLSPLMNRLAGRPDPVQVYEQSRAHPFRHQFQVETHNDLARFVEGRLDLMLRNGKSGLILVLISLVLFLNWRVAMWTAIGLPISFLGTFVVMALMGVSINLLSMFGLIIVLGIIVDDAIVIGENIYRRVEEGVPPLKAAVMGAEEVQWPVTTAVATTIAAFLPLMFIRGQIGDFFRELPLVVIAALSVSLVEALVILPAHLRHLPSQKQQREIVKSGLYARIARFFDRLQMGTIDRINNTYARMLRWALRWRYLSLAIALAFCLTSLGLFMGAVPVEPGLPNAELAHADADSPDLPGSKKNAKQTSVTYTPGNIVKWEFIQKMDSESMYAQIEMPVGTNIEGVKARLRELSEKASQIPEVEGVQMDVGIKLDVGSAGALGGEVASHFGQIWIELLASDERDRLGMRSSQEVLAELREVSEGFTGVNSVRWEMMSGGPGGKDIEIRISGADLDEVEQVADRFKEHLATYAGVVDLSDNLERGKRELQLRLLESARPTGITKAALGGHVRAATYGAEARRITRNREDVKIMVRYPERYREDVFHIESMYLPTPPDSQGNRGWVPLKEVAEIKETRGHTQIHRSQQRRAVTVSGEIDTFVTSANDVLTRVKEVFVPQILEQHPGIRVEFLGSSEEQAKSFGSLKLAFPVALLIIYMMLAALFKSYVQPLVVMSAIPFGLQGAIIGHWLTNNPMTILSMIGLIALTGIVVNDSLVLVDFINRRIRAGLDEFEASIEGATLRLRPILLTTVTTSAGLTPMMFETSFQAKFLIPMAVTLTFGLIFATALTLLIVPVLNMIFFDIRNNLGWLLGKDWSTAEALPASPPQKHLPGPVPAAEGLT